MPDPTANAETFDLPTAGSRGRGNGVILEEMALAWNCPNGSCRFAFDEIAAIELEADVGADEPFARCDVFFANGERLRLEITNDAGHAKEIETFRAFIVRFFAVLGPVRRAKIVFREGSG